MTSPVNDLLNPYDSFKINPSEYLSHGTTYSALYQMSRLKGENHNSLVSYGTLDNEKIPVFSGECFRGIAFNGVNRGMTSWYPLSSVVCSFSYAKRFPFSLEEVKAYLNDIIKNNEQYKNDLEDETRKNTHTFLLPRPPFANMFNTSYWNKIKLKIRQLRAWDETLFQKEFKEGLFSWMNEEMAFMQRPILKDPTSHPHYKILESLLEEVQTTPAFQLTDLDKENLSKSFPIIFITSADHGCSINPCENELGIEKKLKLGEDIQTIATASEFIETIQAHLRQQSLATKVNVVSFAALGIDEAN